MTLYEFLQKCDIYAFVVVKDCLGQLYKGIVSDACSDERLKTFYDSRIAYITTTVDEFNGSSVPFLKVVLTFSR